LAISVTTDLQVITTADTTTASGTFYRLNGVNTGNPLAEADAFVQGAGCIANKTGGTTGATDVGGHFNATATFDLTGLHLFVWRLIVTAGNMLTRANQGVSIGLTNTSTTSTSAWSTTNMKRWNVDGSDTMPVSQGWKCYVIDPAGTADVSAGTLTLSTVRNVGILCRQNTAVNTALNNVFVDVIRRGTGLTATTSLAGDTITLLSIYDVDRTTANAWGILTQNAGIYYGAGKINIGATGQAQACNFSDTDQVLIWRDYPVADTLYEFNLKGASGNKTTMTLTSCVVRGQAGQVWNITADANSDFKAYGCSFANLRSGVLSAGSVLDNCSIDVSGTIDVNGATITGCSFSNQTASQLKLDAASDATSLSGCSFASDGTGHAIEITAAGTYTLTGHTFSGYAASNGSTGNETIYVNLASGTVNISVDSSVSVRTAGATVNVTAGQKTLTVTNIVSGSDVVILSAGTDTVLAQNDGGANPVTSFAYSYTYSAGVNVDVAVYKAGYVPYIVRNYLLENGNASLPVAQVLDRNYTP
jgi:hypothetical protein